MGIYVKVGANMGEFDKAMKQFRKDLDNTFGSSAVKMSQNLVKHLKYVSLALVGVGTAAVVMSAKMEQTEKAFEILLGGADEAQKHLGELNEFAAKTPFGFTAMAESSKQLIAYGLSANQVIPTLQAVGDAASGLGVGQAGVDQMLLALGQLKSAGNATTQDLKQLVNVGINVWGILADKMGLSVQEVKDKVSKAAISSNDAIAMILTGMDEKFGGMMDTMSGTLAGSFASIKASGVNTMVALGNEITEALDLETKFAGAAAWTKEFAAIAKGSGIKEAFDQMVPYELREALVVVAGIVAGLVVPAFVAWAIATIAATLPLLALGAACGAVAGLIYKNWESVGLFFKGLWQGVVNAFQIAYEKIAGVINGIIKSWDWMKSKLGFEVEQKDLTIEPVVETKKAEAATESLADKIKEAFPAAAATANKKSSKGAEKARKKQEQEWAKLVKKAEDTSSRIEDEWIRLTRTQVDALEKWYAEETKTLDESKAANANYARDRERLDQTYFAKLKKILNDEAKERQSQIQDITDGYKEMYDKLSEMGMKGSSKDLFNLEKAAADDVKAASDYFDKLTADYTSATEAQKQAIIDGITSAGIAYKVTAEGMLDFSTEKAQFAAGRFMQLEDDKIEYYRHCKDVQADIDKAYDELSLTRLQETLTKENALRINALETQKSLMDTYQEAFLASMQTTADLAAGMYQGIFDGVSSSISDLLTGVSSLSEAFTSLGESMLQIVADWVAQKLAGMLTVALFDENLLGASTAKELAQQQALTVAKTTGIATTTAAEIASIGSIAAAKTAAETGLLTSGLATLAAFSAASIAEGAAVAAAWAAAAANVSLASFGANAGPAMAGISSTHALTTGLSVPKLADGGETKGPTVALIGEGRYKEAVFPLSDDTFSRFADGISKAGGAEKGATLNVYGDINNASDEGRIMKNIYKKSNFALMGA